MAAMSRQRSYSTRRSPPQSPSHRALPTAASDLRRASSSSNRASVLLSEKQVNKINKKMANIRHNSLAFSSPQLSAISTDLDTGDASFLSTQSRRSALDALNGIRQTTTPTTIPSSESMAVFPARIQEFAVIEDLLFVLMGISGTIIKIINPNGLSDVEDAMVEDEEENEGAATWDDVRYTIDANLDPSVSDLVDKILPLATYYMSINAFVYQYARYEYGSVNHALAAALSSILKEYETFIAQLEYQFQSSGNFTLQQFWFYMQDDTMQQMRILHDLTMTIRGLRSQRNKGLDDDDDDDDDVDIEAVLEGLKKTDNGQLQISEREKGGAILNILTDRLVGYSGDLRCKKVFSYLLARASVPYFEILHSWIYRGKIIDPYNEFMVLEKRNVKKENLKEDFNDTYWEMRYTVREKLVPSFLEPLQNKILLAGKYLNVVRECGVNIANPEDMQAAMSSNEMATEQEATEDLRGSGLTRSEVWLAVDGAGFVKSLEIAYKYANHTLLNLLIKDQQLMPRLRSLKHYFFLDQSDFLTSFLDLARDELKQPTREISLIRLQSLMDLVLRNSSSVAAYDPFKEDLKVAMSPLKLVDELLRIINVAGVESVPQRDSHSTGNRDDSMTWLLERSQSMMGSVAGGRANSTSGGGSSSREVLTGYDTLTLDYTVTFPLSLVISRKALTKYQLLFRHLLYLKHVEDMLCDAWMQQKDILWRRKSGIPEIDAWKFRIFTIRHRMLMFVQKFAYYVTNEVLEPNWRRLETNLGKVSTVDQVLQYHSDFLDTCLKECMLTNEKLLKIYNKLMTFCVKFAAHSTRFSHVLRTLEEQQGLDTFGLPKGGVGEAAAAAKSSFENTDKSLRKLEELFSYHMGLLIEVLTEYSTTETVQFLCLVVRLNYNQHH